MPKINLICLCRSSVYNEHKMFFLFDIKLNSFEVFSRIKIFPQNRCLQHSHQAFLLVIKRILLRSGAEFYRLCHLLKNMFYAAFNLINISPRLLRT